MAFVLVLVENPLNIPVTGEFVESMDFLLRVEGCNKKLHVRGVIVRGTKNKDNSVL